MTAPTEINTRRAIEGIHKNESNLMTTPTEIQEEER